MNHSATTALTSANGSRYTLSGPAGAPVLAFIHGLGLPCFEEVNQEVRQGEGMRLTVFSIGDGQGPIGKIHILPLQLRRFLAAQSGEEQQDQVISHRGRHARLIRGFERHDRLVPVGELVHFDHRASPFVAVPTAGLGQHTDRVLQ